MKSSSSMYPFLVLLIFTLINTRVSVDCSGVLLLEDGYTVSTIIDGNKLNINPRSILPQFGSSDLVVLDSSSSTFYTFSFPNPQEEVVKKLAGNGVAGYADGELGSAMFHNPNSFALDYKGNLYAADRFNHTIRKISKSGVTTIAGGYSQMAGKRDGPAQNASFSDDFELVFIPERCALLISDHGNKLVRQINLKADDCAHGSQSVMGQTSAWALSGFTCLLGLIIGFVVRPYVTSRGGRMLALCNKAWTHSLTHLGRQLLMLCFDMKNGVASSTIFVGLRRLIYLSLSTLSLMFRIKTIEPESCKMQPSLLDCDHLKNIDIRPSLDCDHLKNIDIRPSLLDCDHLKNIDMAMSHVDQLRDLIRFDEGMVPSVDAKQDDNGSNIGSAACNSKVDALIEANVNGFTGQANENLLAQPLEHSMGLVKRR